MRSKLAALGATLTLAVGLALSGSSTGSATEPAAAAAEVRPAGAGTGLPVAYREFLSSVGGSRFVTVDGVRMHYVEAGSTTRPTLLLLHGSPDNVFAWRGIMPELARRYHVVAPDLIGFGRSGTPAGSLTWAAEIRYLTRFIEARRLRNVTLVTTDIGGLFGFAYARSHPRNVEGIVLWETVTAPIPSYEVLGSYCPSCVGFFQGPKDPVQREQFIVGNPAFAEQVYGGAGLLRPLSGDELAGYAYFLSTRQQRANVADIGAQMPIAGAPAATFRIVTDFARYLRTSPVPKLVLYAAPGAILPGSTAIGLGTPNTSYASVGAGYHYLAEDAAAAVTAAALSWRASIGARR